jgi:hypothetical protein
MGSASNVKTGSNATPPIVAPGQMSLWRLVQVKAICHSAKEEAEARTAETTQGRQAFVASGASIAFSLNSGPGGEESGTGRTGQRRKVKNSIARWNRRIERGTEVHHIAIEDDTKDRQHRSVIKHSS